MLVFLRRTVGLLTIAASLVLLGQAPLGAALTSVRPGSTDTPVSTEEEQRHEAVQRAASETMVLRQRRQVLYQETITPAAVPVLDARPGLVPSQLPPPSAFRGAALPLRC